MRTTTWLLTPMFALALTACGDDGSGETTNQTSTDPTTAGETTGGTTEPGTTEPATTEPVTTTDTTMGATTEPATTTDPTTTGEPSTGDPDELSCENYCAIYEPACKDFDEYDNTEACLSQCAQWPMGLPNDTAGDSLGCRTYHATVASAGDAELHCPHAGPSGAATCVAGDAPTCETYCATYFTNCKDDLNSYVDMADCMGQCGAWYPGTAGMTMGDTIGCRDYHAGVAVGEPATHCPHAGPGGADVCVTP